MIQNAMFYSFKQSGKWYASDKDYLSPEVFAVFNRQARRNMIVDDNGGAYPGLSGPGSEFIYVVIPDEDCEHGFPLMLNP